MLINNSQKNKKMTEELRIMIWTGERSFKICLQMHEKITEQENHDWDHERLKTIVTSPYNRRYMNLREGCIQTIAAEVPFR